MDLLSLGEVNKKLIWSVRDEFSNLKYDELAKLKELMEMLRTQREAKKQRRGNDERCRQAARW